ncbi:MAG: hypothetical protein E7662_06550 [Ruminococcaceae bacterium]|nr:hypothetical protein [Oscillospiraceae bacterium]
MKKQQITSLLLAVLMLLPLASCAQNPGSTAGTEDTAAETTAAPEPYYLDVLSDKKFDGVTFTMVGESTDQRPNFCQEEQIGQTINDAIYDRQLKLETRYGVNIDYATQSSRKKCTTAVNQMVQAEDDTFDLVFNAMTGGGMNSLATAGSLTELTTLPHLDFTRSHWAQTFIENMKLNGKLLFAAGGSSPSYYLSAMVMLYNVDEANNRRLPNLYELVSTGKWTIDKMGELINQSLTDVNGDGVYTSNEDFYGVVQTIECARGYFVAGGGKMTEKTADGSFTLNLNSASNTAIMDKLRAIIGTNPAAYTIDHSAHINDNPDNTKYKLKVFTSGHAMFAATAMMFANQELRDMNGTYGVLPVPKLDENQKDYITASNPFAPCGNGIPRSATDVEMSALIMEAMAFLGEEILRPAIYNVTLHGKLAQDKESSAMLDIIYNDIYYDFNFCFDFGSTATVLRYYITADDTVELMNGANFSSAYAAVQDKANAALKDLITAMERSIATTESKSAS